MKNETDEVIPPDLHHNDSCDVDHADFKNNGLITKIWGGPGWTFGHSVTFGYPVEPTEEHKIKYRNYFIALGDVLPCRYCCESYKRIISTGETALTDEVLANRANLTKWFWRVHNATNDKLEMDYGITYEDLVDRYESFRAKCGQSVSKGCVAPLDYKAFSFKRLYSKDAPIVELSRVEPFVKLAEIRGLTPMYFEFIDLARSVGGDFNKLKEHKVWVERNKFCQKQIIYMRENAVPSVEPVGKFVGTPTVDELKLLMFLSSNLNKTELAEAGSRMNGNKFYNSGMRGLY